MNGEDTAHGKETHMQILMGFLLLTGNLFTIFSFLFLWGWAPWTPSWLSDGWPMWAWVFAHCALAFNGATMVLLTFRQTRRTSIPVRCLACGAIVFAVMSYLTCWGWIRFLPWEIGSWWTWLFVYLSLSANAISNILLTFRERP